MTRMFQRFLKRVHLRHRAMVAGERVIGGRFPSLWSKRDHRALLRLNRLCAGLPAFQWPGSPRWVRYTFESQVSLHSFGLILKAPTLSDSVRDLMAFNRGR